MHALGIEPRTLCILGTTPMAKPPLHSFKQKTFETGSDCGAQADLQLMTFLPQPPKGLDYRYAPQQLDEKLSFKRSTLVR